jgi:flavin reductase (DIM6/NTAB) family NADH-FMN oxidoreductase RutF
MNDDGIHSVTLVIGKIVKFHILQAVHEDGTINTLKPIVDWQKLRVVGRLGGDSYTSINNHFNLIRPSGKL